VNEVPEGEFLVGTKPEKKPPVERGWQGLAKEDWVTEWFCGEINDEAMQFLSEETYLWEEIKLDLGTDSRDDVVGAVCEFPIGTNSDFDGVCLNSSDSDGDKANDGV